MSEYTWVGLDVHAESITAAILEGERDHAEVITLSGDLMKVRRLFRQLAAKGPVRSCYEASGAGFVLHRVLTEDGFHCEVIAPSLIPKKPGDHRKTDRIDAVNLARLYRSGHLTPVHVPSCEQEALRRLIRLRYTYQCYTTATKHRIGGMLRNHGHVFTERRSAWTKTHRAWLGRLRDQLTGPLQTALAAESEHLEYLEMQRTAFDAEIEAFRPVTALSRSRRGSLLSARRQDPHRHVAARRDRRRATLPLPASAHGLLRPRSLRAFFRRARSPGSHHQSRQHPRPTTSGGSRLEQSPPRGRRSHLEPTSPGSTCRRRRHRA